MSTKSSFQLDPKGGEDILQKMAEPTIRKAAEAIRSRALSMAGALTSDPPEISISNEIGIIRRGVRAIATVRVNAQNKHQLYIGRMALSKSKDAGRV